MNSNTNVAYMKGTMDLKKEVLTISPLGPIIPVAPRIP